MNPTLKRWLLIGAMLVAALLIAWIFYRLLFAKPSPPTDERIGTPVAPGQLPAAGERGTVPGLEIGAQPGALPTAGVISPPAEQGPSYYQPQTVNKLVSEFAVFPSVSNQNGDVRYHNDNDGKFYRLKSDGTAQTLSDQVFYNVSKVTWAGASNKAVLEYPDSSKIIYNFDTQRQVSLPKHWEEFSWSPDGAELAAKSMGLAPENRWLVTTKDDGTGTQLIEPLGDNANRVNVDWSPSRQTVALSRTGQPQGADRQEVLFVGLHGENFRSTIVEGLNFMPRWSPTGHRLLYSVDSARSDFKPEIWVVDAYGDNIGNNRRALKLNTWANKCAFGNEDTLYCAVPRELPQGAGMSPAIADSITDDLYKIDLKTGLKTNIPLGSNYHLGTISYDHTHNKIIFTDPNQTGILQINL